MAGYVRQLNALLLALGYDGRAVSARDFYCRERFPNVVRVLVWLLDCCCASSVPTTQKQMFISFETKVYENVMSHETFVREAAGLIAKRAGVVLFEDRLSSDSPLSATPVVQKLVALSRALLRHGQEETWRQRHLETATGAFDRDNACGRLEAAEPGAAAVVETSSVGSSTGEGGSRETAAAAAAVTTGEVAGASVAAAAASLACDAAFVPKAEIKAHCRILPRLQELRNARSTALKLTEVGAAIRKVLDRHNSSSRNRYWQRTQVFLEQLGLYLDTTTDAGQHAAIEAALLEHLQKDQLKLNEAQAECEQIQRDIKCSTASLQKAMDESQRVEKRLEAVHSLKSPFQEEYDRLMNELNATHAAYVIRVRNARFLEQQAERPRQEEQQLQKAQQRQLEHVQEKLREDAAQLLRAFGTDSVDVEEPTSHSVYAPTAEEGIESPTVTQEQECLSNTEAGLSNVSEDFPKHHQRRKRLIQQRSSQDLDEPQLLTAGATGEKPPFHVGGIDSERCARLQGNSDIHERSGDSTGWGQLMEHESGKRDRSFPSATSPVEGSHYIGIDSRSGYFSSPSGGRRQSIELGALDRNRPCLPFGSTAEAAKLRRCESAAVTARQPTVPSTRVPANSSGTSTSSRPYTGLLESTRASSSSSSVTRRSSSRRDSQFVAGKRGTGLPTELSKQPVCLDREMVIDGDDEEDEADAFEAGLCTKLLRTQKRRQQQQLSHVQALQDVLF